MVLDLQHKFEAMEKKNQTFTQTLKNTIKQELMKEFEGIINGIRNDMNTAISTMETKFEANIKKYEKIALEREARINEQNLSNFRIAAGELLQKTLQKSPSEDNENPLILRGEGQ